jgi:hypothetical protein
MQVDRRLPIDQRQGDVAIHSLSANIGQYKHCNSVTALFISLFEWRMFSRWIVTNITSARGTVHCRKTRIPCGDQPLIFGLYKNFNSKITVYCASICFSVCLRRDGMCLVWYYTLL